MVIKFEKLHLCDKINYFHEFYLFYNHLLTCALENVYTEFQNKILRQSLHALLRRYFGINYKI